jgi:hypothetical protein
MKMLSRTDRRHLPSERQVITESLPLSSDTKRYSPNAVAHSVRQRKAVMGLANYSWMQNSRPFRFVNEWSSGSV